MALRKRTFWQPLILALGIGIYLMPASASAVSIYGTLSNFDIYNTTPEPCEGAEIELEGIHASEIGGDFPAHFDSRSIVEYNDAFNNFAGTRITYTGYNFPGAPVPGSLLPNPNPASTNGHQLTYTDGGEHFGFWLTGNQPSAQRFFWLNNNNGNYQRIGNVPELVPGPTWTYVPPAAPADPPAINVVIQVPVADLPNAPVQDSVWMKVFVTEVEDLPNDMQGLLEKLMSGDPNDPNYANLVPQSEVETEIEWELLEGGNNPKPSEHQNQIGDSAKIIIRRYEFYKYTGPVDDDGKPDSQWNEIGDPIDMGERGDFISANMVAAVLGAPVPEPSSLVLGAIGLASLSWLGLRKR